MRAETDAIACKRVLCTSVERAAGSRHDAARRREGPVYSAEMSKVLSTRRLQGRLGMSLAKFDRTRRARVERGALEEIRIGLRRSERVESCLTRSV